MSDIRKRRLEKETFQIDFSERMDPGEDLESSPVPTVKVYLPSGGQLSDKSTEFGPASIVVSGDVVQFTLAAATGTGQAAGIYVVSVKATTSNARVREARPELLVLQDTYVLTTLGQIKDYIEVDHIDDDGLIDGMAMRAEALMRRAVSRDLFAPSAGSEQEEHFDGGQHKLFLKHYPVISGSVTVVDTKGTVDATDDEDLDADLWRLDPEAGTVARVTANGSRRIFDDGVRRWKVKYRGGMDQEENWVTIQAALKESIHRLVSHWYNDPGRTAADPRGREKEREIVPEDIVGAWENYGEALA